MALRGAIARNPHSYRYHVTDYGFRIALFFSRTYAHLLRPGLAVLFQAEAEGPAPGPSEGGPKWPSEAVRPVRGAGPSRGQGHLSGRTALRGPLRDAVPNASLRRRFDALDVEIQLSILHANFAP